MPKWRKHSFDGLLFAKAAIEFAALGLLAEKGRKIAVQLHLYALALEIAFKSLALRAGATPEECKQVAGHKISKMIAMIEAKGVTVPPDLKRRLNDDDWFRKMLGIRYPVFIAKPTVENTLFFHKNYPEMIAAILEIPCDAPLTFTGRSALAEIKKTAQDLGTSHEQ